MHEHQNTINSKEVYDCNADDRYGKKEAGTGEHLTHF